MSHLVILGCGYSGIYLAKNWAGSVSGTTRSRHDELERLGIHAFSLEDERKTQDQIAKADAVIISTPPPDPALKWAGAIEKSHAWVGYLSTTAVFGDHQGAWVDETTPPNPKSARGKLRLETEQKWQALVPRVNSFRLAGIYGVGRGPLEKIRSGRAKKIIKPEQVFGRIHVEDIARILIASYEAKDQGELYALSDDRPAPPQDVLDYAAMRLGVPPLEAMAFEDAKMSEMARSFYEENKRIDNAKIKARFGELLYRDYEAGIDVIYAQEQENPS